ncbi:MAG: beta-N-acetylhexosaminidase [Dehalococcoidia bacterium]|nr:beta-N-acetylhexosaminidase [Dehalococcoidia bacterium]
MSWQRLGLAAAVLVFFLLGFFLGREIGAENSPSGNDASGQAQPTAIASPAGTPAATSQEPSATPASRVAGLPLEVKIGQMMMAGFAGTSVDVDVASLIEQYHLGNVVLFGPNVTAPDSLRALTTEIQQRAQEQNEGLPALISADQEGGTVTRLTSDFGYTEFPNAQVLGCIDDPQLTREVGRVMGEEMRAVGINMDLAPVLDVNDNPANPVIGPRAFGSAPTVVSTNGLAFMAGLQSTGVAATGKHYPGHGNTSVDSHEALPVVNKTREELETTELAPFAAAVGQGSADVIMTAHVLYPALDPDLPATLSPSIIDGVLRSELGFGGVVMTDSLNMGAIAEITTVGEAAVQSVEAGVDLIAFSSSASTASIYESLLEAVQSGRISEERIDQSVERILAMKDRLGVGPDWAGDPAAVGSADHQAVRQQVADQAAATGCG